jgi:hypothetical protein
MSRPDEGLIHTWLDGECTPEESARVEALVASDPAWAAAVAEARGLVAASSRILGALDAVPDRVLPEGTRATPIERARRFRVRPWMGIAAGLVLVAGTAVVLRDRSEEAFAPGIAVDGVVSPPTAPTASAPAPSPAATVSAEAARAAEIAPVSTQVPIQAPTQAEQSLPSPPRDVPAIGPARVAAGSGATGGSVATGSVATGSVATGSVTTGSVATGSVATGSVADAGRVGEQELRRATAPLPPAPSLAARAPSAFAEAAKVAAPTVLAGCWRVSAPPELAGLLRDPTITRSVGDTLVLRLTAPREVTVVRTEDRLHGALEAVREACPPE